MLRRNVPSTPPRPVKPASPPASHRQRRGETEPRSTRSKSRSAAGVLFETTAPEKFTTGEPLALAMQSVNRCLNTLHEAVMPKFTSVEVRAMNSQGEYGGITGTIRPKGVQRVIEAMCGLGSSEVHDGGDEATRATAVLSAELEMRLNLLRSDFGALEL